MITFRYGREVSVIPASAVGKIDRATKKDIKVLIALGADPGLLRKADRAPSVAAEACGCTEAELAAALAFWRGAGVIEDDSEHQKEDAADQETEQGQALAEIVPPEKKAKLRREDELPKYTTEELAVLLEQRKEASQLIDECQQVLGKIFNTHEVNIVLGLGDYLELDGSYILTLCDYCVSIGKKSLRYIEKKAFGLYDDGITTVDALTAHIEKLTRLASFEGQIRTLFGMKDRELTTKEKKFIDKWVNTFGYDMDVIKKAYDTTVDAIHEPSPAYANAVMERWHKEGKKTLSEIEAAEEQRLPGEGSFDTDDFFEAALRRSMANMKGE